ncbi:hypothetical protein V5F31_16015 [Xanthobacter sp. V7C-4]|uniref:hypothetical protein n=1 Tax=Xanthobacter autotrophicus (strain ATCC BAA-1158 / Py2) TaxID=78245 RepID=UPI00372C2A37
MATDRQTSSCRPTSPEAPEDGKAPAEAAVPCVGIFWVVMRSGQPELLTCTTPWPQAEDYGDFKTEATAHYDFWPKLRKALQIMGEYEDWPRGRVVYNMRNDLFTAYIDRQLAADAFRAAILDAFHLPPEQTRFAFDAHYSGAKFKVKGRP